MLPSNGRSILIPDGDGCNLSLVDKDSPGGTAKVHLLLGEEASNDVPKSFGQYLLPDLCWVLVH